MTNNVAQAPICDHYWAWVSPAGTSNSARICMTCHQPDADWLNTIIEIDECPTVPSYSSNKSHNWLLIRGSFLIWRRYRVCVSCNYIERVK